MNRAFPIPKCCRLLAGAALACAVLVLGASPPPLSSAPLPPAATDTVDDPRPALDAQELARAIHDRVNDARRTHQLPPLAWTDSLHPLASTHSRDMAERDFFGHVNPSGEDVNDRARQLDLVCYRVLKDSMIAKGFGENLYKSTRFHRYQERYRNDRLQQRVYEWKTLSEMADEVVTGWMNSPGHRRNILNRSYDTEIIAVYVDDNQYFVTQVLC